jgi:purine nucleoside phosphorylase
MIGIIGGTGIYELVEQGRSVEEKVLDTPYGKSPKMSCLNFMIKRWFSCQDMLGDMLTLHIW